MRIKIIIADDHGIYLKGLAVLLANMPGIDLLARATDGRELVEKATILKPDIILTDIDMPFINGVEATRQIIARHKHTGIIALTTYNEESLITDMIAAGARGFLIKNADNDEILNAIITVNKGGIFYCKHTTTVLAGLVNRKLVVQKNIKDSNLDTTDIEIIKLICQGKSSKQIASALSLNVRTVEGYRKSIQVKTGNQTTAELVVYALKNNIYID